VFDESEGQLYASPNDSLLRSHELRSESQKAWRKQGSRVALAHTHLETASEWNRLPSASMRRSTEIGSDTLDWTRPTWMCLIEGRPLIYEIIRDLSKVSMLARARYHSYCLLHMTNKGKRQFIKGHLDGVLCGLKRSFCDCKACY
jgi:hypothetical protein